MADTLQNGMDAGDLVGAFRRAGAAVRDAHAEVIRKREATLLAASAERAAVDAFDRASAELSIAEKRLEAAAPATAPEPAPDPGPSVLFGRAEVMRGLQHNRPGVPIPVKGEGDPATYWQGAAPKRQRWPWSRRT